MKLRGYQNKAADAVFREWESVNSTLVVMPTGCGKTVLFADIIRRMGKRALVLAHREELIHQAVDKIHRVTGLNCGIEMADYRITSGLFDLPDVVVSTIQTQTAGGDGSGRMGKFDPNDFGLVIVDEGHHATAKSYRRVIDYYRNNPALKVLFVTATPDRADEEALGQVCETVAFDYEILDAIKDGWLVPIEQQVVNVAGLDYSGIHTTAGDLNGGELAAVMEAEEILHGIAHPTIEIAGDRRTLVFASSVKHAEMLSDIFNRHRPGCSDWVCGATPKESRRKTLSAYSNGDVQFLCNVGVLTEGFDSPETQIVVVGRPTKSRALYSQIIGRSTRPLPNLIDGLCVRCGGVGRNGVPCVACRGTGSIAPTADIRRAIIAASAKPHCTVLDFAGNAGHHKLVTTADILGGNWSDEAVQEARDFARKTGKPVNMAELIEEQQKRLDEQKARKAARLAALIATAKYTTSSVSPFDVFDIQPMRERGWTVGKELSEKQLAMLERQGIKTEGMTYAQGKPLCDEIFRRWNEGLCSFKMARILKKRGLNANVSREEASRMIDEISRKEGWKQRATVPA